MKIAAKEVKVPFRSGIDRIEEGKEIQFEGRTWKVIYIEKKTEKIY
jgi:hypothetical protein